MKYHFPETVDLVKLNKYFLISANKDGDILVWDMETGENIRRLKGHTGKIFSMSISDEGHLLASVGKDKKLLLWDLARGGTNIAK